ncbi:hypothetical protein C0989_009239, partial [Termitomyces sp. Mn162]
MPADHPTLTHTHPREIPPSHTSSAVIGIKLKPVTPPTTEQDLETNATPNPSIGIAPSEQTIGKRESHV